MEAHVFKEIEGLLENRQYRSAEFLACSLFNWSSYPFTGKTLLFYYWAKSLFHLGEYSLASDRLTEAAKVLENQTEKTSTKSAFPGFSGDLSVMIKELHAHCLYLRELFVACNDMLKPIPLNSLSLDGLVLRARVAVFLDSDKATPKWQDVLDRNPWCLEAAMELAKRGGPALYGNSMTQSDPPEIKGSISENVGGDCDMITQSSNRYLTSVMKKYHQNTRKSSVDQNAGELFAAEWLHSILLSWSRAAQAHNIPLSQRTSVIIPTLQAVVESVGVMQFSVKHDESDEMETHKLQFGMAMDALASKGSKIERAPIAGSSSNVATAPISNAAATTSNRGKRTVQENDKGNKDDSMMMDIETHDLKKSNHEDGEYNHSRSIISEAAVKQPLRVWTPPEIEHDPLICHIFMINSLAKGSYDEVVDYYSSTIGKMHEKRAYGLEYVAFAALKRGRDVLDLLDKLSSYHMHSWQYWLLLAVHQVLSAPMPGSMAHFDKPLRHISRAIQVHPQSPVPHLILTHIYLALLRDRVCLADYKPPEIKDICARCGRSAEAALTLCRYETWVNIEYLIATFELSTMAHFQLTIVSSMLNYFEKVSAVWRFNLPRTKAFLNSNLNNKESLVQSAGPSTFFKFKNLPDAKELFKPYSLIMARLVGYKALLHSLKGESNEITHLASILKTLNPSDIKAKLAKRIMDVKNESSSDVPLEGPYVQLLKDATPGSVLSVEDSILIANLSCSWFLRNSKSEEANTALKSHPMSNTNQLEYQYLKVATERVLDAAERSDFK